jgi:predicted nucleic acid-binding protein
MIIADTSVWIEFLKGREPVSGQLRVLLAGREVLAVECVFGELLQGAKNDREQEVIEAYWRHLPKADGQGIWIEAGRFSGERNLYSKGIGLIDCVLIVTSLRTGARLWTLDKKLREYMTQMQRS